MRKRLQLLALIILSGCTFSKTETIPNSQLRIGAIPDQRPEKLNRLYGLLAKELESNLNVKVKYIPVINYTSAVTAFRTGSIDLVWFGGLTGVQARNQRPNSIIIAQREIDQNFHSVFIANKKSKIPKINKIEDLKLIKGKRFTFGSESSTSGRLMPQYYLEKANIKMTDFKGKRPGFSGSHDATIALVNSGSYDAGALNEQVWLYNKKHKKEYTKNSYIIWRTPPYSDYHWLALGSLDEKFGIGFTKKIKSVLINLHNSQNGEEILDLFGAKKFIPANEIQYKKIYSIGKKIGKIR